MVDVDKTLEQVRHSLLKNVVDGYDDSEDPRTMTNSRLLARFLSRYRWYYPAKEGGPSLDAAWDHYEYVTLARYFIDENPQDFVRAPQGEKRRKTSLYPLFGTPTKELMDFGVSVRMYFSSLLLLATFMALAGVFNAPLILYFWNYGTKEGVANEVRASAICDETEWVACESCTTEYASEYPAYRLDGAGNVRRNTCDFENWLSPALWCYAASILLLVLFGWAFFWVQRKAEIVFDEEVQTASDYSIKISNPPPDAIDPEEWRIFLGRFAQKGVTHLAIALDNAELVDALVKRRKLLRNLSQKLPLGTDMTDNDAIAEAVMESGRNDWISLPFMPTTNRLFRDYQDLQEEIKRLLQRDYKVVAVFATFETERGQRDALHALSTGRLNVLRNRMNTSRFQGNKLKVQESCRSSSLWDLTQVLKEDKMETRIIHLPRQEGHGSGIDSVLTFRGRHVLNVKEACEPNDVRWQDLESSNCVKFAGYIGTTLGMMVFLSWSGFFVSRLVKRQSGTLFATAFITVTNVLVPLVCDFINSFESHSTEGQRQTSLFAKIALFRWFNSAIVLSIISHFIESISIEDGKEKEKGSLVYNVYPIIFAEMVFTPLILLMDGPENFRKHVLAPRARDQEEMNSCFTGTEFELAERYTDATKVMFVALFFSSILPESFFFAAAALLIQYIVGKFCLLRLWKASPDIGFRLARLCRNYFFSTSLVAHITMSAYWWSGFPYDNVCESNGEYVYCNQSFFAARVFPPLPRFQPEGMEWMSSSQATIVSLYGWTSLVVIVVAMLTFFRNVVYPFTKSIFVSTYEPDGVDQGIDFSKVTHRHEIHGYIPQIRDKEFIYPLLTCELDNVDEDLIGWVDPARGFDAHNLVNDAYRIIGGKPLQPTFSIVWHWPVAASEKEQNDQAEPVIC